MANHMPPRRREAATAVLYVGELATYICDSGDVMTSRVTRDEPLTGRLLEAFYAAYLAAVTNRGTGTGQVNDDAAVLGPQYTAAVWYQTGCRLQQHLGGRDVVLVVPLASASTYKEQLLVYLFHGGPLRVCSVVVLSDVMVDAIGCGVAEGVVVHCAPSSITIGHVGEGSTALYTIVKSGTLRSLGIAGALLANASFTAAEGAETDDLSALSANETLAAAHLTSPRYREVLIRSFGYRPYARMCDAAAKARRGEARRTTSTAETRAAGEEDDGRAWRARYDARAREAIGSVEKLLARVTQRGPLPAIIAGEALCVPLLRCLVEAVVLRCGARTLRSAQTEVRALRKRDRVTESAVSRRMRSEGRQSLEGRHDMTCGDSVSATDDADTPSHSTSSASDDESDDDDESWLTLQPLPQPSQPWLLPLLGGSVVGEFSHSDLRPLRITVQEATQTKGTIVHWKAIL